MKAWGKYLKRVGGTVVITIVLTAILFPLLSGLLFSTGNISQFTLRILEIIFMILFAFAGWNIMKKEEQIRKKKLNHR